MSSTTLDLAATRRRVAAVLQEAGLRVLPMEDFPALPHDAGLGSAQMLARCDLLVGVYARRYGSRTADGRSVTELEYVTAVARRLPRLCFVLASDAPWPAQLVEQGPPAEELRRFLERIRSDVIVKEWRTEEDLLQSVRLSAETYLGREQQRARWRLAILAASLAFLALLTSAAILGATARPELSGLVERPPPGAADLSTIAVDSTQEQWAVGDRRGHVFAGSFASRSFTRQHTLPGQIRGLEWLSTDHSLIAVSDAAYRRFSPEGAELAEGTVFERQESTALACDRPARRLAIGGSEGSIAVIDVPSGHQIDLSPPAAKFALEPSRFGRIRSLAFSPNGDQLAVAWLNGVFALLDLRTMEFQRLLTAPADVRGGSAIGFAQGATVVYGGQFQAETATIFRLWTSRPGESPRTLAQTDNLFWVVKDGPRSGLAFTANWSGELALWSVISQRRLAATPVREGHLISDIAFVAGTSTVLVVSDRRLEEWTLTWRALGGVVHGPWLADLIWE